MFPLRHLKSNQDALFHARALEGVVKIQLPVRPLEVDFCRPLRWAVLEIVLSLEEPGVGYPAMN